MAYVTLSWSEFLKESEDFFELTKKLNDSWELIKTNDKEGNTYLCCKRKLYHKFHFESVEFLPYIGSCEYEESDKSVAAPPDINKTEILQMEYHIVYSISYQVPVFYLKVQTSDGSSLEMERIWDIFGCNEDWSETKSRAYMLTALTEMEHPLIFKPFFAIHPCRTAQLLSQTPKSQNKVLTFISIMGPYLKLFLNNQYGL